jgi:hypothetical protein
VLVALLLGLEASWLSAQDLSPEDAFLKGTIGTEALPLPVLRVLPSLFPENFQPMGPDAGDWIDQFGFIREKPGAELPIGFTLSHRRPRSGASSSVPFVGFGCALCHSSLIRRSDEDREGYLVHGAGNASLNFLAWIDAFRAAVLDEEHFTAQTIERAYEERGFKPDLTTADRAMLRFWLVTTRHTMQDNATKYDEPMRGKDLFNPDANATGPSRTQPFRNLVRTVMDRPAATDRAYTKFPSIFQQRRRTWAQFDGSIRDYHARSALAAISAGATADNMAEGEVLANIQRSTDYTLALPGPSFSIVFGVNVDPEGAKRGRKVYELHCAACHGAPAEGGKDWLNGPRQGEVVPVGELGTDPERVNYRYYDELSQHLFEVFPKRHPLHFPREAIRPGPEGNTRGYLASPLESAFVRAPYLHNGSVLTLAELINLEPRREAFLRGNNAYDTIRVGLKSPPADRRDVRYYFRFDARQPGNSNRGHDFPWPYKQGGWSEPALKDLLEFLKML